MISRPDFKVSVCAGLALAMVASVWGSPSAQAQTTEPAPAEQVAGEAAPRLLQEAAAAYADYQSEVSLIRDKPISGADQLDKALTVFGAQNPAQLSAGWIAYAAMIAAQDPEFIAAVRDIDSFYGRDRVMNGMRNDLGYARTLKGGERALQTALAVNARDTDRIAAAAAYVKDQAIKLQSVAWGKSRLKDAGGVATRLKANATLLRPIAEAAKKLFSGPDLHLVLADASSNGQGSVWDRVSLIAASAPAAALNALTPAEPSSMRIDPRRESTANRIMTLAAFHILEADRTHTDEVRAAMSDKPTFDCIDWSQLQLQACVSAAYTRADLSFCLAEHAIGDAGACFSGVAR